MNIYKGVIFFFFLVSCSKPNAPDCFQKGGKEITVVRTFSNEISKLILYDYIHVEMIPSIENYIEIIAPENLIPEITTEVVDFGVLEIRNHNTCNFVRNFKRKIKVKIYMKIVEIDNYSSGDITSIDILEQPYFKIECLGASGQVRLKVDCDSLRVTIPDGVSDVFLSGSSNLTYLYSAGINCLDASMLESNNTFVNSNSINKILTTANGYFFVSINSIGSVYYKGNPYSIDYIQNGSGKLIKL